jgi:uncharacterized protein with gpF-like domain
VPSSIVAKVINLHRAQLQGVIELGGIRKVRSLYETVRSELEAELADLRRGGKDQSFTAFHLRLVLLQVRDGLKVFQTGLATELDNNGLATATLAQRHVVGAIKAFEKRFAGTEPVLRLEEAGVFAKVYRDVEPTLLHRYHKLTANYPMPTLERVRNQLALSMIKGEGVDQTVNRIAAKGGLFDREKWRAERIVRSEGAWAYGVTNQRALAEVAPQVPGLMKKWVETMDARTGEDSKELQGQTVAWDAPFVWMKKTAHGVERVEMMHGPNRPNDRSCIVPWRQDYHGAPAHPGPVDPTMPRGL